MIELLNRKRTIEEAIKDTEDGNGPFFVRFYTQGKGVVVPTDLDEVDDEGFVSLKFSARFKNPVKITDEGLEQVLSFKGKSTRVFVPFVSMSAVFTEKVVVFWIGSGYKVDVKPDNQTLRKFSMIKGGLSE